MKIDENELREIRTLCNFRTIGPTQHNCMGVQYEFPDKASIVAIALRILKQLDTRVTVRQLYYQMVANNVFANHLRIYKDKFIPLLTKARKADVIPWQWFADRSRSLIEVNQNYDRLDPDRKPVAVFRNRLMREFNDEISQWYRIPKWSNQEEDIEVWTEKDALSGFMTEVCDEWEIPVVVCKGYLSYTFLKEAEERLDYGSTILYFGDLDPSGIDIPRNIQEGLDHVSVERVALNPDDVAENNLAPNPIKYKDPRAMQFHVEHGDACYELDALPPAVLKGKVRGAIESHFDFDQAEQDERDEEAWQERYVAFQAKMLRLLKRSDFYKELEKGKPKPKMRRTT